jgi:hypothetical protein
MKDMAVSIVESSTGRQPFLRYKAKNEGEGVSSMLAVPRNDGNPEYA